MTPELERLIAESARKVAAMTPEERAAMWEEQRQSYIRAMTQGCEHGVLDFEQCPQCREGAGND